MKHDTLSSLRIATTITTNSQPLIIDHAQDTPFAPQLDSRHHCFSGEFALFLELVLRSAQIPVAKSLCCSIESQSTGSHQQLACSYDTPCWIGLLVAFAEHSRAIHGMLKR
jgi:hypothetical protein